MKKQFIKSLLVLTLAGPVLTGCQVLEQAPQASLSADASIVDATTAQAAVLGAYNALQSANAYGTRLILLPDMAGGNLAHPGTFPSWDEILNRAILTNNAEVTNAWIITYDGINRANNVIARVPNVTDPTLAANKAIYVAEGKFLRAFNYFTLVKLWGGVPIILDPTTSTGESLKVTKSTADQVYKQIEADLDAAIADLPTTYGGISAKGRATKAAAYALKARVALYQKKWADVVTLTSKITGYSLVPVYSNLFDTKNTAESIWELQFDPTNSNSMAFFLFSTTRGGRNEVRPSNDLLKAYPAGDTRTMLSTSYDSKIKYFRVSTGEDNVILLRYGEVLLNQAEALNELGGATNLAAAAVLVNQIRVRAGLKELDADTKASQAKLRDEIFLQRRLELALEGQYWNDIIRTGRAPQLLPNWSDTQAVWPIPLREINANPNLVQNSGY